MSEVIRKIANKKIRIIFLIISAFLTGLTVVFPKIGFIEWVTLIPVGIIILVRASDKTAKLRWLYLDGLAFFFTYYAVCFHWFVNMYPLDFIDGMTKGTALLLVILGTVGLSLFQAIISAFAFVLVALVFRSRVYEKINLQILKPFIIACIWTLFEWVQTLGWWGVPWGRLPIGQTGYLFGVQNASWFGSYFITFMIVAVNLLLAFALINPHKLKLGILCAVALLLFQYGSGALIWYTTDVTEGEKITVACIQGNVSSSEKWDSTSLQKTFDNYIKYTKEAADNGAELVIWPETAFPYDISQGVNAIYGEYFSMLADNCGIYLLVGAYTSDSEGKDYNSLVCYTPDGSRLENVYSKRHLVPFGEYVPLRPVIEFLIPPLAELVLSDSDAYEGEGSQVMQIKDGIEIGCLICFDSIYDELTLESVRDGAELICLSSNDSWFTDSRALYIHNAHARLRAVESGRYVARAANTGLSTAITPRGEIVATIEPLVEGILMVEVYATDRTTLWSIIGNSFIYYLLGTFGIWVIVEMIFIVVERKKST